MKANDGIDPDAPEEPAEPLANGVEKKIEEAKFELNDTLAFPGGLAALMCFPSRPKHTHYAFFLGRYDVTVHLITTSAPIPSLSILRITNHAPEG